MEVEIHGSQAANFDRVRDAFRHLWEGIEVGAALTVFVGGEKVVELWGGWQDRDMTRAWRRDTIVNTYSTSKGPMSLAICKLMGEGRLRLDEPVAEYWPEFGAENKFTITVREALSHQAGLVGFDPPVVTQELFNWQYRTHQIASQKPIWSPGTASGYHAITWGYIAGEIIRRITGQMPGDYIRDTLCTGEAEFMIGVPDHALDRCADVIGPNYARSYARGYARSHAGLTSPSTETPAEIETIDTNDPVIRPFADICSRQWRQAQVPASNGHACATGLAAMYANALNADGIDEITRPVIDTNVDLVLGKVLRRSSGFILNCEDVYMGPEQLAFGHSGTGGSIAFADPVNKIAFAYVMNQLRPGGTRPADSAALIDAVYRVLS